MTVQLGEAAIPIRAALDKLDKDLDQAKGKVGRAIDGIVGSVKKVGAAALAGVGVVSGVATAAALALGKLAIDAAPVEGLQNAFEGLATSSGSSMDEMLAALKRGSSGMISQRDLMMSYNQAAQLVSTTFANQLPDAMQYLSKVSAATGQDMGFMLDSLVKGVGRLSPMILDNLGIQVSLEEATANAAAQFGVEAGELTKAQIQAGMMNVVLEKLAANTASMPDVTDSATAGLARMKAVVQDTKDRVGMALLPALNNLTGLVGSLAERYLPVLVTAFEEHVVPVIEKVTAFLASLFRQIGQGVDPVEAFAMALETVGLDDLATKFSKMRHALERVGEAWDTAKAKVGEWWDGTAGARAKIAGWYDNFKDTTLPAWKEKAAEAWDTAKEKVGEWWDGTAGTRAKIAAWYENFKTKVLPEWSEAFKTALVEIKEYIETNLVPALDELSKKLEEDVERTTKKASDAWEAWTRLQETWVEAWNSSFKPALDALLALFGEHNTKVDKGVSLWDRMHDSFNKFLSPGAAVNALLEVLTNFMNDANVAIKYVARAVDTLRANLEMLKTILENITLPDWLTPGSPTPMELGIRGISDAMSTLTRTHLPKMMGEFSAGEMIAGGGGGVGGGMVVNNYFGTDSVRSESDIYRLAEEIDRSLNLRGLQRVMA